MSSKISVIRLSHRDAVIISRNRMVFLQDASDTELREETLKEKHLATKEYTKEQNKGNSEEYSKGSTLSFMPTFDCNLRCIYCYSKGGDKKDTLNPMIAKEVIKRTREDEKTEAVDIHLVGGGEPLLRMDVVDEIISYAEKVFTKVTIHIVTNGTFDNNVFHWIKRHNCHVRVSYDGTQQDGQRPFADGSKSKTKTKQNIIRLVNAGIPIIVQCIITKNGAERIEDIVSDIINTGIKIIKLEPALATDVSRSGKEVTPNPRSYALALLRAIGLASVSGVKIDTGYFACPSMDDYCGITASNRTITPHGLVTKCVEVSRPIDPYAGKVIIGKVKDGRIIMNEEKEKQLRFVTKIKKCLPCKWRLICQSGCPMANIWQTGFPPQKSPYTCAVQHNFLPLLLSAMIKRPEIRRTVIDHNCTEIC